MRLCRHIVEGDKIPKFYGVAYFDYIKREAICYPIPLNLLIWIGYLIRDKLTRPRGQTKVQRAYMEGYNKGCLDTFNYIMEKIQDEMKQNNILKKHE